MIQTISITYTDGTSQTFVQQVTVPVVPQTDETAAAPVDLAVDPAN